MADAVEPVVAEIFGEKDQHKGPPSEGDRPEAVLVHPNTDGKGDESCEQFGQEIAKAHHQAGDRVADLIIGLVTELSEQHLQDDQRHKARDRVLNGIG